MSRWHESGCKRPDVSTISGIPCCNYCFALPSLEDATHIPDLPILQPPELISRAGMSLSWPSIISYSHESLSSSDEASRYPPTQTSGEESLGGGNGGSQSRLPVLKSQRWMYPEALSHDHIRLLRLRPAPADGPIHADIEIVHLRNPSLPKYEALSYTWADDSGDYTRCCPVFLGEYWDIAYVTRNCEQALRAVRSQQVDRLLWLDSLCINQGSVDEKSQQVGLLREIFSKASRVVAYIGGESPESNMALRFLQESAAAGPITSGPPAAIDRDLRRSIRFLFQRPYFSRLWAVQEVLLARELEIISGRHSAPWPKRTSALVDPNLHIPTWLFRDQSWYGFTSQDLLRILLNTSPYECSDPRDKIFAVLGLIYENDIIPDYRLPVESIYTGFAAYLIKHCHTMDFLALSGINKKTFNIPSWVPDWSQQLPPWFPNNLLDSEGEFRTRDAILLTTTRVVFHGMVDSNHETQVNANTGSMRIRAVKLCDIAGLICQSKECTYITMPIGSRVTFIIIALPEPTYQTGTDAVFLLSEWDHPVILRHDLDSDSYLLVSPCILSFGPPPSRKWFRPWVPDLYSSRRDGINVSALSPEENNLLLEFHSRLAEFCRIPTSLASQDTTLSLSTITDRMLDFFLLSLTSLRKIETRLRKTWDQSNHKLGWMFRDQAATWKLMQEINQGHVEQQSGQAEMRLEKSESVSFAKYCGVEFPSTYHWDLGQFCWSFLQSPVPELATTEHIWSPVFNELESQLPEIRTWAKTTEQLLQVFEYTRRILGRNWTLFPGNGLQPNWHSHYQNFQHAIAQSLQRQEQNQSAQLDASCLWNWAEFEDHLRAREQLWDQKVPHEIDPSINKNMAALVGLKSLGLEFYNQQIIQIK